MRRIGPALAILSWAAACADLPDIALDRCGNRVLEDGEVCDGFAPEGATCGEPGGPNACHLVCDAPGRECPAGYGCGADGRCREITERFDEGGVLPLRALDLRLGDADGDGRSDLVAWEERRLIAAYATGARSFGGVREVDVPRTRGAPQLLDFDGDRRADVLAPIDDGIFVMLGAEDREMVPVASSPLELEAPGAVVVVPLQVFTGRTAIGVLAFAVGPGLIIEGISAPFPPGHDAGGLLGPPPIARLDQNDRAESTVLAFRGLDRLHVFTASTGSQMTPVLRTAPIQLPAPAADRPLIADFDGDGRLDVLAPIVRAEERELVITYGAPAPLVGFGPPCPWSPTFELFRPQRPDETILAAGQLDGDGVADLVTGDAIVLSLPGASAECGQPARNTYSAVAYALESWTEARIGDFNGDGRPDVAAIGDRALEIHLGSQIGLFNRRRIAFDSELRGLRGGDFDGDSVEDLVLILDGEASDRVAVVFGARDGVAPAAVPMGAFPEVSVLEPVNAVFGRSSIDAMTDLVIGSRRPSEPGILGFAIARGDPSRRLFSPFSLGGIGDLDAERTGAIAAGELCRKCGPASSECVEQRDVLALSLDPAAGQRIWLIPGATTPEPGRLSAGDAQSAGRPLDVPYLCDPIFAVLDVDGDGLDEVAGVDRLAGCPEREGPPLLSIVSPDPEAASCLGGLRYSSHPLPSTDNSAREISALDADGDGHTDLLILLGGKDGGHALVAWNDGGQLSAPVPLSLPGGMEPLSGDRIRGPEQRSDLLLLLTTGGGARSGHPHRLRQSSRRIFEPPELIEPLPATRLRVTDLDLDGLDDLLLLVEAEGIYLRFGGDPLEAVLR